MRRRALGWFLVLLAERGALAACSDLSHNDALGESSYTCLDAGGGKVDLFLDKSNGQAQITVLRIRTVNAPRIRNIFINNQDPRFDFVVELYGETPDDAPASIDLIQGFGRTNVALSLDTSGDVGTISRIRELFSTTILGNVTGNIELQSQGDVVAGGPDIPRLTNCAIRGDLQGNLVVAPFALPSAPESRAGAPPVFGIVQNLTIDGRLGTLARGSFVNVPGFIRDLRVGELNARLAGGQGKVVLAGLDVTQDTGGSGDVHADILCHSLSVPSAVPNAIRVAGALHADIVIDGGITNTSVSEEIAIGAMGLRGHVMIGAALPFGAQWGGAVTVGGMPLDGPEYSATSASLGGGAVGLVPFGLHEEDCSPRPGAVLHGSPREIRIAHYGPVTFDAPLLDARMPVIFEMRNLAGGPWMPIDSNAFRASVPRTAQREVRITPLVELPSGAEYRVRPNDVGLSALRCNIPGREQPLVGPYEYTFAIDGGAPPIDGP